MGFIEGRGWWMGLLCFVGVIGEGLVIGVGFMRGNVWIRSIGMSIGKVGGYGMMVGRGLGVLGLMG